MKLNFPIAAALLLGAATPAAIQAQDPDGKSVQATYRETYRPQYHFTPRGRWIGDPCGLCRDNGTYLAYSWGGAKSTDLVHWQEMNQHAIKGMPPRHACFTGSVVKDHDNTAGFGPGALVAVFTEFDEDSKKQMQSIAFSLDGGETFNWYDQNPVLDIWSTEFRDPTVIWMPEKKEWVMLVAKALNKKVGIYTSKDLKNWEFASDFGPMGDVEKSWECPDMFEVAVDGDPDNRKWVMLVSVNWAREQYFVGDFDGTTFIPDKPYSEPLYVDEGLDYYASRVFQNFDTPEHHPVTIGWVNTWDYAQQAPTTYGKGIWSIPRRYALETTPDGLRLVQTPWEGLEELRGKEIKRSLVLNPGLTPLKEVSALDNTYELDLTLTPGSSNAPVGVWLCQGDGRKVSLTYDPASETLFLDRMNTSAEPIAKFPRASHCKVAMREGKVSLRIFVDKSTVEVFADGGRQVMSLLTYAAPGQSGVSLFSADRGAKASLKAWPLKSIWHD